MNSANLSDDDLRLDLKYILAIGRFLGLLPSWSARKRSLYCYVLEWMFSFLMVCFPCIHFALMIYQLFSRPTVTDISKAANAFEPFLFYGSVAVFNSYVLLRGKSFEGLLSKWKTFSSQLKFKERDRKLFFHANIIALFVMTWGACENILFDLSNDSRAYIFGNENTNASGFERIFSLGYGYFATAVPYNWFTASVIYFSNKIITFAWNYMDILIIVICRALYFKFKALTQQTDVLHLFYIEKQTCIKTSPKTSFQEEFLSWDDVRSDYLILNSLVEAVNDFFHPIVFLSYCNTVYNICLALHNWIIPHDSLDPIEAISICISFFQFVLRALLVTYFASNVNIWAQRVIRSLQNCPNSDYNVSVERLERLLIAQPIHIHGMTLLIITRKFLLSIMSFMFTFEIIMLQTMSPAVKTGMCKSKTKSHA